MFGFDTALAFLALLVGFGFLIFVHELGHFAVAKWVGVRCTQFAIGFGQSLLTYRQGLGVRVGTTEPEYIRRAVEDLRDKGVTPTGEGDPDNPLPGGYSPRQVYEAADKLGLGETEYRFNWVPLGGYVKMLGQEDLDPSARSTDPRSFNNKPIWARACVISAGVVMNVIFGLLFFIIAFAMGVEYPAAEVGGTVPGSPAATTYAQGHEGDPNYQGLQVGDQIVRVGEEEIRDMTGVRIATALASSGDALPFLIDRPGHDQPLTYLITPTTLRGQKLLSAGIMPPTDLVVAEAADPRYADLEGSRITAVDGQPVEHYGQYHAALLASRGQPMEVTFTGETNGPRTVTLQAEPTLVVASTEGEREVRQLLGLVPATTVTPIPDRPAAEAGMLPGDVLERLGGVAWPSPEQVVRAVADAEGEPVAVTVWRDGERVDLGPIKPKNNLLGIHLARTAAIVGHTLVDSPAAAMQLPPGSRITAVAGQPVQSWADVQRQLTAAVTPGEPATLELTVALNIANQPTEAATLDLSAEQTTALAAATWAPPAGIYMRTRLVEIQASNPVEAAALGIEYTHQFILQTYITLLRVFQGSVPADEMRGPVGIIQVGTQTAEQGWSYLLYFLGLISVNLAVINFLPIPIVDGGLMVFLIIEKIKGSPASPAVQVAAMWIGLVLIGSVFLFVTYHDLARLATGG